MVVIDAALPLAIVSLVWLAWRVLVWVRQGGDVVRELVVTVLFLWSLVTVRLTFFPMRVIFYDWHSSENLVPFASILQLIRDTNATTAFDNIGGNLFLFMPFGVLLPLLFRRLRSPWPLVWRAALLSVAIEIAQFLSRSRAIDVDDVILNTAGATIGFGAYRVLAAVVGRSERGRDVLERLGAPLGRRPLLAGAVPIGLSLAIVVPVMLSTIVGGTIGDGDNGILAHAAGQFPGSSVIARSDVAEYTFVTVVDDGRGAGWLGLVGFERVLPGRYTLVQTGELPAGSGSRFDWFITVYNETRGEIPIVVVWGANEDTATTILVAGNGVEERLSVPSGPSFAVGFPFDVEARLGAGGMLADFDVTFFDAAGTDITKRFSSPGR